MKKLLTGLCLSTLFLIGISSAGNITVENKQSLSLCNANESHDVNYYLGKDGYSTRPIDTFGNITDSLISRGPDSSVQIRRNGVISDCNDWERVSTIAVANDSNGALVFHNQDWCNFNIPTYTKTNNPKAIDAQIHYTVGYRLVYPGGSNSLTSKLFHRDDGVFDWTCYPNGNVVSDFNSCPTVTVKYGEQKYHVGECLNYRVFRCGDGLVNGPSGSTYDNGNFTEQCDPKAPGWTESTCDPVTCQPIGKLKITKTLSTARKVTQVGEEVKWIIKVTAENGDVKDFVLTDKLPEILDYVRFREISNPSNLKLPNPPHLNNGLITWNVEGTLKSGQSLEIELVTKANKMPTQDETNWACVEPKGNTDPTNKKCDDDYITGDKGKLEIKKVLSGAHNQVENTGDIVTWNITVKAVGADVTNFTLKDHLPKVLDYEGVRIVNNPSNLEMGQANVTQTSTGTNITWEVKGTLKKDQTFEIELISKANAMPQQKETNVACVKGEKTDPNPDDPDDDCDDDYITGNPKVWLKKAFSDGTKNKTVRIGDLITYKITFGNSGGADATITAIKDFLPKNVEYVSSEIYVNGNKIHTNLASGSEVINSSTKVDGVYVDIFTGMTLKPGDTGYILLTGKVLSEHQDSRTNFACIYVNDEKIECDDARHDITDSELLCKSNIKDKDSADLCYGSSWTVPVTCESEGGTGDTIAILCDGKETFTGKNISQLTGSCVFSADGDHTVQCKVNGSTKAASGSNCEGVYNLKHHSCGGGSSPSCSSITTNPEITKSLSKGSNVDVTCKTSNGSAYVLIDCDYKAGKDYSKTGNFMISTGRVTEFTGQCKNYQTASKIQCLVKEYESSSWQSPVTACAKDVTIKPSTSGCFPEGTKVTMADGTLKNIEEVQEGDVVLSYNTATNTNEKNVVKRQIVHTNHEHEMYELTINGEVLKVTDVHPFYVRKSLSSNDYSWIEAKDLKVGNVLLMNDGRLVKIEKITHYANLETVYNLEVEGNHNYFVDKGYLVHNKGGGGRVTPIDPDLTCFNVNGGNASIEKGEILPFYLNIYKDEPKDIDFRYVEHKLESYPYGKNNLNMAGESCSKSENGDVALNTLMCHYSIKDGNNEEADSGKFPCLNVSGASQTKLVKAWIDWQVEQYGKLQSYSPNWGTNYTFRSNVHTTNTTNWKGDKYGEYKIYLDKVEYVYCDGTKWTRGEEDNVCQSNFVLTNSYTVQKTPSGNFTNTSTDKLKNYLYADGTSTFNNMAALLNKIAGTSAYDPTKKVETAMENFINKYKKLAVRVKSSNISGNIKKVPGKNIYFAEDSIMLTNNSSDNVFTIVQTDPDKTITVKGNVQHNMMLLTKGKIIFEDTNTCIPTEPQKRQTVKGIFYAQSGLERKPVLKNNDITAYRWCSEGGLTVKGVLIGSGLNNLMKNSRSNLTNWWDNKTAQTVMNGASVLIEYSPSIFTKSTMPPGAEDFTTALTVYKN